MHVTYTWIHMSHVYITCMSHVHEYACHMNITNVSYVHQYACHMHVTWIPHACHNMYINVCVTWTTHAYYKVLQNLNQYVCDVHQMHMTCHMYIESTPPACHMYIICMSRSELMYKRPWAFYDEHQDEKMYYTFSTLKSGCDVCII